MSGKVAGCRVFRLSECLAVISEHTAGRFLVKRTPSIAEVQRTSGISGSNPKISRRYFCCRPIPAIHANFLNGNYAAEIGLSISANELAL
jgi:hypothetical protein